MTLQQGTHFPHHDDLVTLDVAFDEVEALQFAEQFAAAAHLGRELHVGSAAGVVYEVLPRAEVARLARRVVGHHDGFRLRAQGVGKYFGVGAAAEVAAQRLADRGHRFHGVDLARGACEAGDRAGVVAEVGADVDACVARAYQLRQVVDVLRGRGLASDAQPLPEEEQPAHGAQVAF